MVTQEETKQMFKEQTEKTEQAIDKGLEKFENSAIGKKIPLEIKKVSFSRIYTVMLLFYAYSGMAIHLSVAKSAGLSTGSNIFNTMADWIYSISFLLSLVFDLLAFYGGLISKVFVFSSICKLVKAFTTVLIIVLNGTVLSGFGAFNKILLTFVCFGGVLVDLTSLYYNKKLQARVASNEYDKFGDSLADIHEISEEDKKNSTKV